LASANTKENGSLELTYGLLELDMFTTPTISLHNSNSKPTTHNQSPYLMQMEGKNPVSKKEFLNGFKDFPEII
jgi:hypothetical protein